jgi:hypothetical protein
MMNRRSLAADLPLRVGEVTIIPVAEVQSLSYLRGGTGSFAGRKRAAAVVALGPWGSIALDISGEEAPLDELLAEVPGLEEVVAGARREAEGIDTKDNKKGGA